MDIRDYSESWAIFMRDLKEPDLQKRNNGAHIDRVREIYWELQKERRQKALESK